MNKTWNSSLNEILMDGINNLVFVIRVENDSDLVYEYLNRAAMKHTGYYEEIIGKTFKDMYLPEKAKFLFNQYMKVVISKESVLYEDSFFTPSGETIYSETRLTPLFDEERNVKKIVAVVTDITAKKLEEKKKVHFCQQYESLFTHNPDAILTTDINGKIQSGNHAVKSVTGYSPEELIGTSLSCLFIQKEKKLFEELFKQAILGTIGNSVVSVLNASDEEIIVSIKAIPLIIDDKIEGIYCIMRNTSELIGAKNELDLQEKLLQIIGENASDLITLIDNKGEIIYASPSYKDILGIDPNEYIGKLFLHNVHQDFRVKLNQEIIKSISKGEPFRIQVKQYNRNDEAIWFETDGTPTFDKCGHFKYIVVLSRDIQLQKKYEEKLKHYAFHDPLTGLPNRLFFNKHFPKVKEKSQNNNTLIAVGILDLDHFKKVNDQYGHDVGDKVIKEFGNRMNHSTREIDIVARLGGDEFAILFPKIDSIEQVVSFAKNILKAMKHPWKIDGNDLSITTSIGIAIADPDNVTRHIIMKKADSALYHIKDSGRNSFKIIEVKA